MFRLCVIFFLLFTPHFALSSTINDLNDFQLLTQSITLTTCFFVALIFFIFVYFIITFDRFAATYGTEILTTIGIFGCFWGIAISLLHFNIDNITDSVPQLLAGIQTAFISSVTGIFFAFLLRVKHRFAKNIPQAKGAHKTSSLEDLIEAISNLQKGLVGNEEGTLLTQMKLLRQDNNDQLQSLRISFDNFSKHILEQNQKALIEALREVIKDFNEKLTEQFGENFKQLNSAVHNLVVWQQQYKEELDIIKQAQLQTVKDMQTASQAFTTMVNHAKEFSIISADLQTLLLAMSQQKDVLFVQEKALSELLIQMKDVTPQFADKLSTMLNEIATGVKRIQIESSEIIKNFGAQAQSANADMKNLLSNVITDSQKQLSQSLTDNVKVIKEGVLALDKALQKELNDSLTGLGKQLAALSEKFVEDYLPLTESLRKVVRMAEGV